MRIYTPEEQRALQQTLREYPIEYIERATGHELWEAQRAMIRSVQKYPETLVAAAHGTGKTKSAADLAVWFLQAFFPHARVITLAPTDRQVKTLLWGDIRSTYKEARKRNMLMPYAMPHEPIKTEWNLGPDCFALGMSPGVGNAETDQGVRLSGQHCEHLLVIFDEAPGVDEMLWMAKEGILTGAHARFLGIGNPIAASGSFYNAFRKARRESKIRMMLFDTPNFRAAGITDFIKLSKLCEKGKDAAEDEAAKYPVPLPAMTTVLWAVRMWFKWGPDSALYKSRALSEFPVAGQDALIALAWLESCADAEPKAGKGSAAKGIKCLGVDPARSGSCNTVIYGMTDGIEDYKHVEQGIDTMSQANRIISLMRDKGYRNVAIDSDGLGAGVVDRVTEWASHDGGEWCILEIHGGAASSEPELRKNLRAEMYWNARELVRTRNVRVRDEGDLFHQLTSIKYRYTSSGGPDHAGGQIEIEQKEQMAKRGMPSPDEADAFVYCCHAWLNANPAVGGGKDHMRDWAARVAGDTKGVALVSASTPWRTL